MAVNTKQVERRTVRYNSYNELLEDAERLAGGQATTVGNWTLGQIFHHLAKSIHASIDGTDMKFPWIMKKIFGLIMNKEKMMNNSIPAGFKIPQKGQAQFAPDSNISKEDGLAALREAIERIQSESTRAEHPAFGVLTREEWDKFNLRHAELHLSFANCD